MTKRKVPGKGTRWSFDDSYSLMEAARQFRGKLTLIRRKVSWMLLQGEK